MNQQISLFVPAVDASSVLIPALRESNENLAHSVGTYLLQNDKCEPSKDNLERVERADRIPSNVCKRKI